MAGIVHMSDVEAMGDKADMTHEEVVQMAQLTPEEQVIEKKLRRKIDMLIMPLVVLVYLLNYIDRWVVLLKKKPSQQSWLTLAQQ